MWVYLYPSGTETELKNAYIGEVYECDFTQSDCWFTLKQNSEWSYGRDSRWFYVYNGNTSSSSTLALTWWKIPSSIYSRWNLKKLELFVKRSGGTQSSCGITVNLEWNRFRYIWTNLQARRPSSTTAVLVAVGGDTNWVEYKYTVDLENSTMSVSFSNNTLTIPSAQITSFYTDRNAGNTNLTLVGNTWQSSAVTVSMSKAIFYY